jgi:FkbM family methyltransferase
MSFFQHWPVALSNEDGVQTFYQANSQGVNGSYSLVAGMRRKGNGLGRTITVKTARLETLMTQLGHHDIDILKIDVEGFEVDLLRLFLRSGVLPRVVFVDIDAICCCMGTTATCLRMKREAIEMIGLLSAANYSHVTKGADYTFFLPQ